MTIFFSSDHHFYHSNVIKYCNRPFSSVEEMNESLVAEWNKRVRPNDTVYYLGDFSLSARAAEVFVKRLMGSIILIPGNHDRCHRVHKKGRKTAEEYCAWGFKEVHEQLEIPLSLRGSSIVTRLCHLPYRPEVLPKDYNLRYLDFRPTNDGKLLIHGHVHNHWKKMQNQINVGVDVWDFKPVALEEIEQILDLEVIQDPAWKNHVHD